MTTQPTRLSPLPIRVRPNLGEGLASYLRRLAQANHLKPDELAHHVLPSDGSPPDLTRLAQITGRTVAGLRLALVDAPGRVATEPVQKSPFPLAVDRKLTKLPDRIDLVLLLSDAHYFGTHRRILYRRCGINPRLVRIALQHQPPLKFNGRNPDSSTLFRAMNALAVDNTADHTWHLPMPRSPDESDDR